MRVGKGLEVIHRLVGSVVGFDVGHFAVNDFLFVSVAGVCARDELVVFCDDCLGHFFVNGSERIACVAGCKVDCLDADAESNEIAVEIDVYRKRRFELQINVNGYIEVELFEDVRNVRSAFSARRQRRDESDDDVLHHEHADLAVRDVENDLHLLVRAHFGCFTRGLRFTRIAEQAVYVAEKVRNGVAGNFAKVGVVKIERFATELSEIDINFLSADVHRENIGAFNDVFEFDDDL